MGWLGPWTSFAVEPGSGADEIAGALLREVVRSARNKGCRELEVALADDPAEHAQWQKLGFQAAGQRLIYSLAKAPVTTR
jgi:ribosomal protein S18 acetylase RimI-like enzyme